MINIFLSDSSYINIKEFLIECLMEFCIYSLNMIILLIILLITKKISNKHISTVTAFFMPLLQMIYIWQVSIRSEFFYSVTFALLLTMQLRCLCLFSLKLEDLMFFFSALLFPSRLFNSSSAVLGDLWLFWIIFSVVYITSKISLHKLKGNHFCCYFLFVVLTLSAYSFHLAALLLPPFLSEKFGNSILGLVCAILFTLFLFTVLTIAVNIKFNKHLLKLNGLGKKYETVEKYFFSLSLLVLTICTLIFLPFTLLCAQNFLVLLLFPFLCLTLLWIQMPFIILLFRVAFYKDSASFSRMEKESLAAYYRELSESLAAIGDIRHDIKNIFFTMGNFVDRSNDTEMKSFFWKNIFPYSVKTIQQNELLSKIYRIPNESLKAFFYLKISQILAKKAIVLLEVSIIPEHFKTGMEVIDLTRILGILIDNAVEEVINIPEGIIEIKIKANNDGCSYIIQNSVTDITKIKGIREGITTKGGEHGRGLLIVKNILGRYDNAVLNSYFYNSAFTQSLNISTSYTTANK